MCSSASVEKISARLGIVRTAIAEGQLYRFDPQVDACSRIHWMASDVQFSEGAERDHRGESLPVQRDRVHGAPTAIPRDRLDPVALLRCEVGRGERGAVPRGNLLLTSRLHATDHHSSTTELHDQSPAIARLRGGTSDRPNQGAPTIAGAVTSKVVERRRLGDLDVSSVGMGCMTVSWPRCTLHAARQLRRSESPSMPIPTAKPGSLPQE